MSIYSGFPTRKDEQRYNSLVCKLLSTLQTHLLTLLGPAPVQLPEKLTRAYIRILSRMRDYEEHKYLPPKFSALLDPFIKATNLIELAQPQPIPLPLPLPAHEDEERVRASSKSLHKPKFNTALALNDSSSDAKKLPVAGHDDVSPSNVAPRPLFQSVSSKLARPKQLKGIFPANHRVELSEQYEQPLGEWESARGRAGSKGGRVRYRAFQALQEAQTHLNKHKLPLREEMRRKLRTEEGGAREEPA